VQGLPIDSTTSEQHLFRQVHLPEFLLSYEVYLSTLEPPMRNFHWAETTNQHQQNDRALLGLGADTSNSRRTRDSKQSQRQCSPADVFLILWFSLALALAVYLVASQLLLQVEIRFSYFK